MTLNYVIVFMSSIYYIINLIFWPVLFIVIYLSYRRKCGFCLVNCWFCCQDVRISSVKRQGWYCPHCEQYNGFAQDGGYNRPILAEHAESLNISRVKAQKAKWVVTHSSDKIFCNTCIQNQLLKVKQLANFVPYNEANFDQEAKVYEQHLESVYQLCAVCEDQVQRVLEEKNSQLMANFSSLLNSSSRTLDNDISRKQTLVAKSSFGVLALKYCCCTAALVLVIIELFGMFKSKIHKFALSESILARCVQIMLSFVHHQLTIVLAGFGLMVTSIFADGRNRLHIVDVMACFAWLSCLMLQRLVDWTGNDLSYVAITLLGRHVVTILSYLLALILTFISTLIQRTHAPSSITIRKLRRNASRNCLDNDGDLSGSSLLEHSSCSVTCNEMKNIKLPDDVYGSPIVNHKDNSENHKIQKTVINQGQASEDFKLNGNPLNKKEQAKPDIDICTGDFFSMKLSHAQSKPTIKTAGVFEIRSSLLNQAIKHDAPVSLCSINRPLISPARFQLASSTNSAQHTSLHNKWTSDVSSANKISVTNVQKVHPYVLNSSSSEPEHLNNTTAKNCNKEVRVTSGDTAKPVSVIQNSNMIPDRKTTALLWIILTVSIALNLALLWSFTDFSFLSWSSALWHAFKNTVTNTLSTISAKTGNIFKNIR